jgi:hypothetical protein
MKIITAGKGVLMNGLYLSSLVSSRVGRASLAVGALLVPLVAHATPPDYSAAATAFGSDISAQVVSIVPAALVIAAAVRGGKMFVRWLSGQAR